MGFSGPPLLPAPLALSDSDAHSGSVDSSMTSRVYPCGLNRKLKDGLWLLLSPALLVVPGAHGYWYSMAVVV